MLNVFLWELPIRDMSTYLSVLPYNGGLSFVEMPAICTKGSSGPNQSRCCLTLSEPSAVKH